jgi:N-acetyl-gamma-glutamyl-phosphate reductase
MKNAAAGSKKTVRCAILGASGYSGMELVRLLALHPHAEIVAATSNTYAGKSVRDVFPWSPAPDSLKFVPHEKGADARNIDVFFTAFPHGKCFPHIAKPLKKGRIIDISADFRLRDKSGYVKWYDYEHPMPELLGKAVYGMPEVYRKKIRTAKLVANPGCYPTSVLLGLLPLAALGGAISADRIIVDAKSGYSGAGRSLKPHLLFTEGTNEFTAYKVTRHSHIGEMQQEATAALGRDARISFTPHLLPVARGILSTIYVPVEGDVSEKQLREIYGKRYASEPFVRLAAPGKSPSTKQVTGTNLCLINVFHDEDNRLIKIISAIDNLVKGAAGQAIQNMNIMFGLPETEGLPVVPLVP